MEVIRRFVTAEIEQLADDEVQIRMSTSMRARDGHILLPAGALLENYRANPVVLWQHNPDKPVGTNSDIQVLDNCITARTRFAPAGISATADEVRGLVKAGVVRTVSIGFVILDGDPIDPAKPRAGLRATKWELLECSFVTVPADPGAVVTERDLTSGGTGASGQHEERAAMVTNARATDELRTRMLVADPPAMLKRDLYDCAWLANMLSSLGYLHDCTVWEAELEGDNSPVPAMLGEALQQLGATLIAMTAEEVAELLSGKEISDDDAMEGERELTPRVRAWRRAMANLAMQKRAGKVLSAANAKLLADAHDHIDEAQRCVRSVLETGETDTQAVQTSNGTDNSTGSEGGRSADFDYRRRQAALLELAGGR